MDELFGLLFWIVILLIWSALGSKAKKVRQEDKAKRSEKLRKLPEEFIIFAPPIPPVPSEKETELKEKKTIIEAPVFSSEPQRIPVKETEIKKEPEIDYLDFLSEDKLQEGVILSLILAPPKAYSLLPTAYIRKNI